MINGIPFEWAALYAGSGLPVLPLHSIRDGRCTCGRDCGRNIGKHPLTTHGKDDATTDVAQVAEWVARWPWANWGIRPPAGLIVLDVDPRNGGDTELGALASEHGQLPETLTARTGGGGLHIWLAYTGRTRGQLCPGVDVKTSAGYVVAPPSLHASGDRYSWVNQLPVVRAPSWVRRRLNPPSPLVHTVTGTHGRSGNWAQGLIRAVAGAAEGNRNKMLHWAACRAYEHGATPQLLADLVAAAMSAGLDERSAHATVRSAARTMGGPVA